MGEVMARQVGHRQFPEDVVEDRGGILDRVIALDHAGGLELGEGEGLDIFLEAATPYCRPSEMAMAKLFIIARKAAPSLCMSMKDLAQPAVVEFAGAQIDLVACR